jgi:uncharacterized membrane protein
MRRGFETSSIYGHAHPRLPNLIATSWPARIFGFDQAASRVVGLTLRQWVWVGIAASAAFQVLLSLLYFAEFKTQAGDLGTFMQAFSSVSHGLFFWETPTHARFGTASLVNVHFSWVVFAVAPVYGAFPSATTLFVIQALVLSLAAVPLHALATLVTKSPKLGFLTAMLYLSWAPLYAGNPDSFHLETFVPIQLFSMFWAVFARRYQLALALGALASLTLDGIAVFPFLTGVFFLTYPLQAAYRKWRNESLSSPQAASWFAATSARLRSAYTILRSWLRMPIVRASLGLMFVALLAFLAMRLLEAHLPAWLGLAGQSLPVARIVGFGLGNIATDSSSKAIFWILLFATVGFLPLLSIRTMILTVPWVIYTLLESQHSWYTITEAHVTVIAFPLFIGAAFGLRRFASAQPVPANAALPMLAQTSGMLDSRHHMRANRMGVLGRRPSRGGIAGIAIILLLSTIVLNLCLNPLNPIAQEVVPAVHQVALGGSVYRLSYPPSPSWMNVVALAKLVPATAPVIVWVQLYPLLTSDPYAYPTNLISYGFLPFNQTALPEYILAPGTSTPTLNHLIPGLATEVWNQSMFGVRAWVEQSSLGSVFLWERGYSGKAESIGPTSFNTVIFTAGTTLQTGPAGYHSTALQNGKLVSVVRSDPGSTGLMWKVIGHGAMRPGTYRIEITAELPYLASCSSSPSQERVLDISSGIPGPTLAVSAAFIRADFPCGQWTTLDTPFTLQEPVPGWYLNGFRDSAGIGQELVVSSVAVIAD